MNFATYGQEVLDLREQDAIRAIESERLRFRKHLETCSFATTDISQIRPKDIAAMVRTLGKKMADDRRGARRLSSLTVAKVLQLTSAVFDMAVEAGLRDDNPCVSVRKIRRPTSTQDAFTVLTKQEQFDLEGCEDIPVADRILMMFAVGTGLRQGEQWSLEWRDVHLHVQNPYVTVRFGSRGLTPKNGKIREVPLFGLALTAIQAWEKLHPIQSQLVFPTINGHRRQIGAPKGFKAWLKAAGITRNVRWHDLRHSCASSLLRGDWGPAWSLLDIRDMLGHSSISVTERYAHLGVTSLQTAAARMR